MRTEDLIKAVSADAKAAGMGLDRAWLIAIVVAVMLALVSFFAMLGPRPDITDAAKTLRFLFKFVLTLVLAFSAWRVAVALSRPGAPVRAVLPWLLVAPILLVAAVMMEMMAMPQDRWMGLMMGRNNMICLIFIPLIGIGPLAAFLAAMRHGAPTNPTLAGAVAGLFSGGVAATLYAAHCVDDSPMFVATWYIPAIAVLAVLGAVGGRFVARW